MQNLLENHVTVMQKFQFVSVFSLLLLTACASNPNTADTGYSNFLVLAIADDYTSRAQYERTVASGLRSLGSAATPYHEAVGGSGDISREKARELINERGFDAVLVTHVRRSSAQVDVKQDSAAVKVTRKNERPIDFFRYDYEELDEPGAMNLLAEASLDSNLHRASDGEIVWDYSWTSQPAENVGKLIDDSSSALVRQLDRNKLVGD